VAVLHADDYSTLNIFAGTDSYDVLAHFVVTDPVGRRTGQVLYPSRANLKEIPNAKYIAERLGDEETSSPGTEGVEFWLRPVHIGTYTVTFSGVADTAYTYEVNFYNTDHNDISPDAGKMEAFISSGAVVEYKVYCAPSSVSPIPNITKTVTFAILHNDVLVAQKLNQLGGDKFVRSLSKTIDLAEKLSAFCDKRKHNKDKGCVPAVAVLKLFVRRLELANHKCDSKNPKACDEDKDWDDFGKAHRKDHDYDDFFKDWDRDEWHKHKKTCKRYVSDEALKIISEDTQWLIKSLGGEFGKAGTDDSGDLAEKAMNM
jgi:hypothetical protein